MMSRRTVLTIVLGKPGAIRIAKPVATVGDVVENSAGAGLGEG
jgi:hypothetical protein